MTHEALEPDRPRLGGREPETQLLEVVEPEDVLGELRRDAPQLRERLRHVDAHLDPLLREDTEVTAEGLVGPLEIVDHRPAHVDATTPLVAHEEVRALLAPVAALHALLPLQAGEERPATGMPGLPGEEPPQGLHGLACPALALLEVGQQVEELRVVREGAQALLEHRLTPRELARAPVSDRQARPVSTVGRGIHGLPVVLDRLGGPAGLVGVPAESRVAAAQRAPDVVAPAPGHQVAVPLARRRDLAPLVEGVRLPRRAGVGVIAGRRRHGLDGGRQARLRQGVRRRDGRRVPAGRRVGGTPRLPPAHQDRAGHAEHEDRGQRRVQPGQVRAAGRRGRRRGRRSRGGRHGGSELRRGRGLGRRCGHSRVVLALRAPFGAVREIGPAGSAEHRPLRRAGLR